MKTSARLDAKIKHIKDELSRAQVFLDLLTEIRDSGFTLDALAQLSGVAPATLYFWISDYTKRPRIDTVTKVASALGFDIRLYRLRAVRPAASQRRLKSVK